jgi:hypothetical protein
MEALCSGKHAREVTALHHGQLAVHIGEAGGTLMGWLGESAVGRLQRNACLGVRAANLIFKGVPRISVSRLQEGSAQRLFPHYSLVLSAPCLAMLRLTSFWSFVLAWLLARATRCRSVRSLVLALLLPHLLPVDFDSCPIYVTQCFEDDIRLNQEAFIKPLTQKFS